MRKKNTLYTVNKWNQGLFVPENLFAGGSSLVTPSNSSSMLSSNSFDWGNANQRQLAVDYSGAMTNIWGQQSKDYVNNFGKGPLVENNSTFKSTSGPSLHSSNTSEFFGKDLTIDPSKAGGNAGGGKGIGGGSGSGSFWQSIIKGVASVADTPFTVDGYQYKRGIYDATDPFYKAGNTKFSDGSKGHIENKVGNTFSDLGVQTFKEGVNSWNPYTMLAGAAFKSIGDVINNAWGMAYNDKAIKVAEENTNQARKFGNVIGQAGTNDDLLNASGFMATGTGITDPKAYVKGGVFKKGKAKKEGQKIINNEESALAYQGNAFGDSADNVDYMNDSDVRRNFVFAYGGPMDNNMGAIGYDFMDRYLTTKEKQANNKNQMTNMFMGMPSSMFGLGGNAPGTMALGGVLQAHGSDFSTGLTHVDAGGSHEESPYDGVQMGVDGQGVPNLVEENETVWNDYVFSNRILADEATKQMFKLPKKKDVTFADISKKLEKEIQERPNDPISKAGFNAQMQKLEEEQERQKAEMEAARAREAFEALSDEEKVAVMQELSARENLAAQAEMEQAAAQQQPTEPSPEEMAMMEQQQMAQPEVIEQPVMAEGGKLNLYGDGGTKNSGKFKDKNADNWGKYSIPGLKAFIEQYKAKLNMAPDEKTKDAIRQEAIERFNNIQKSYASIYPKNIDAESFAFSDAVQNHQNLWNDSWGNTGFYTRGDNGNIVNLIDEAIDKPNGADTKDRPESWKDGYWGPRTSLRNFGSTEYGDDKYYTDLTNAFKELGLNYAPNKEWKYGDNTLYGLSMLAAPEEQPAAKPKWTPEWQGGEATPAANATGTVAGSREAGKKEDGSTSNIEPIYRPEWMRYAGLLGPAVGLGMMAAGVGRPNTKELDAALDRYDKTGTAMADYQPIGDYLTYRPMDIWFEQNRMNANARATDRALVNSNTPARMAGLLASGYNSQIASGDLYRKALEYNDALRERTATFNRGTNQFNAEAYNRAALANAQSKNASRGARASLAAQIASQKMDADAGWYNSLYANVGNLFRGIGDMGRENAQWNMIADSAADGVYGNLGDSYTSRRWTRPAANGGKLKKGKKGKKGLTY